MLCNYQTMSWSVINYIRTRGFWEANMIRTCSSCVTVLVSRYTLHCSLWNVFNSKTSFRWYVEVCCIQYIPRNMHTVFALLCFVVVIHWLIFPYPSGLLHWHCGNLTIAPVPAKQPWWIWINTSCEFIMNDCITTTKQSTTKPCAYFLGYTVATNIHGLVCICHSQQHEKDFDHWGWTKRRKNVLPHWRRLFSLVPRWQI